MAEKRMFSSKVVDSDDFLDMPLSAQALYFHLNMEADDEGFINNPKKTQRAIGASADDLKLLIAKRFLICFESGVVVVKHWMIHNSIRKDRRKSTNYKALLETLDVKDNGAYTEKDIDNQMTTKCQPSDNQMSTQYRLDKNSIDKVSIEEIREEEDEPLSPSPSLSKSKSIKHKYGEYNNVLLTDEELAKLKNEFTDWAERIERLSSYIASTGKSYKSHYVTIRNWAKKDAEKPKVQIKPTRFNNISGRSDNERSAWERMQLQKQVATTELSDEYKQRVEKLKEELGQ